jgi:hypothetical protein
MVEQKPQSPIHPAASVTPNKPSDPKNSAPEAKSPPVADSKPLPAAPARKPEIGGPKGPDPTRYGDWEKGGRCIDF